VLSLIKSYPCLFVQVSQSRASHNLDSGTMIFFSKMIGDDIFDAPNQKTASARDGSEIM